MPPISREQATQIAQGYLQRQPNQVLSAGGLMLKLDATIERPYGWVFFYNTRRYLETGHRLSALGGNAPILVERATGQIYVLGTAHPVEWYLDEYERNNGLTPA